MSISVPATFTNLVRLAPWSIGLAIVSAVLSAALGLAPFWLIYLIAIELLLPLPDNTHIWSLAIGALALFLLRWFMMALSHVAAHFGAFSLIYRLRLALADKLERVPLAFFSRHGEGSLRRTLSDDTGGLEGFYAHMLPDTAAAASVPILTLVLLFFADWRLALAVVAPLPLAFLAQWWWMARTMPQRMQQWADLQKSIANHVGEYVRCIAIIKSFGLDAHSFGNLEKVIRGAVDWVEIYAKTSTGGFVVFTGLLRSAFVVLVPLGAWFYLQGSLDLPTYLLFLLVSPLVLEPILRLMFAWHELLHKAKAMERINAILQAQTLQQSSQLPESSEMKIEFVQVSHHYEAQHCESRTALKEISFTAQSGELTAIVGASGSGKSTLLRLIARLYEYEVGQVLIGGLDVRAWPLDALLSHIAVVFQDVFLFSGTVRENLQLARMEATEEEIEVACRRAQAYDFICGLPHGLDTPLGEDGARLSGGERQRLAIARALIKDAPILLLDEAMACLDAENEALIRQALLELCQNRTVLMICHNLHSAMVADQILVLNEGELIAHGHHEDLLRDCTTYQTLWHDHIAAQQWEISQQQGEQA